MSHREILLTFYTILVQSFTIWNGLWGNVCWVLLTSLLLCHKNKQTTMKISAALLLAGVISSTLASLSSVAAGGCVTTAISQRDQCLCGCIRSGYNCETGDDLMPDDVNDEELKDRCKSAIVAGGPCRWDPNASRTNGSSCTNSCPSTSLCDGGGVDPPAPS